MKYSINVRYEFGGNWQYYCSCTLDELKDIIEEIKKDNNVLQVMIEL